MRVLAHHIYEYEKGLRSLVLHTLPSSLESGAVERLRRRGICFHVERVSESRINIFLGDPLCVEVVTRMCRKPLETLSPEEDFILGIMLGYSRLGQCRRYIQRKALAKAG
ncbi:DUF2023 family protein [Holophaga foetida]|uniref:DUF2023 family protein n=1 Tax=Holophaga foetida TaxID=35839 RepID=UPI0002472F53|nr:DUF2023 family protein [Holophaga foetida]